MSMSIGVVLKSRPPLYLAPVRRNQGCHARPSRNGHDMRPRAKAASHIPNSDDPQETIERGSIAGQVETALQVPGKVEGKDPEGAAP